MPNDLLSAFNDDDQTPPPTPPGGGDDGSSDPNSISIEKDMQDSFLAYSLSVIGGRAIPFMRDGLKPVHRRILVAMGRDLKLFQSGRYSKCAGMVGEVLKKYHPHGDGSVYQAAVRLAQPWSMRYPLIDGQGNFGSIDGDSAAAYRYTECRLTALAAEFLADIEKDTVDWTPNFDGTIEEPMTLPVRFPNLLVNGDEGIAVGMATKIPPHNLKEVLDGTLHLLNNPDCSIEDLIKHIPGPDFPTGGIIMGRQGIHEAYKTGRGRIIIRSRTRIEEVGKRTCILVDEVPFQVKPEAVIDHIAELVKDKKIEGIADANNDSDRNGFCLRIILKKSANPQLVLNRLLKYTDLEKSFSINCLAISGKTPVRFTLKQALEEFITHRKSVVVRRSRFELKAAQDRKHLVEGLIKAQENIDDVIKIVRNANEVSDAKAELRTKYDLSEKQANAVVEMRLRQLVGLEKKKLEAELLELVATIARLESIINDHSVLSDVITKELEEVREKYGDKRRTEIQAAANDVTAEDLIKQEDMVVTVSHKGYVKRTSLTQYREQRRGGKGRSAANTKDDDFVQDIFVANTHNYILVFTDKGKCYWLKVYDLPETGITAAGRNIINLIQVEQDEKVRVILPVEDFDEKGAMLFFCTAQGVVKRVELSQFSNPRSSGIRAATIAEDDYLVAVKRCKGGDDVLLATSQGQVARYPVDKVRAMGRGAGGCRGITLGYQDVVVGMEIAEENTDLELLSVTEKGYGKRSKLSDFPSKNRGVKGVRGMMVKEKNGKVVNITRLTNDQSLMLITNQGTLLRCSGADVGVKGRATQGTRLMRLSGNERVVALAKVANEEEDL